jgi:allophanate hydrolase
MTATAAGRSAAQDRPATSRLAVAGAHLAGQPLHPVLLGLGAALVRRARTAPLYRMVALPPAAGLPPRPGLIRRDAGGAAIEVEVYELPVAALGALLVTVVSPLAIGTVVLDDGSEVPGFVCEEYAAAGAPDITRHGGWRRYLASA